jgi:hypothetical protein
MAVKKVSQPAVSARLTDNTGKIKKKPGKFKKILKIGSIMLLLLILIVGGFFLGIYFRIFDTNVINEKMELYKYPIIGDYFVKPTGIADDKSTEKPTDVKVDTTAKTDGKVTDAKLTADTKVEPSKPVVLSKDDVEKQMKLSQAEEKKRISKLARLYGQMKPKDAVAILDDLNDDVIIEILQKMDESQSAQILAGFDPAKSARLTQSMYNGKPPVTQIQ